MRTERERRLAEDGLPTEIELDAWVVPDPPEDLTDRVLSALTAEVSATAAQGVAPGSHPDPEQEEVHVHATASESSPRLVTPIVLGIAAAAAILLAFWLGRNSVEPAPPPAVAGPAEVRVAPIVLPPAPPPPPVVAGAAELPESVRVTFDVQPPDVRITLRSPTAEPRTVTAGDVVPLRRDDGDYVVELRTLEGSVWVVALELGAEPDQRFTASFAPPPPRVPPPSAKKPSTSTDLKDPFDGTSTGKEPGVLRIGTNSGVPPAVVYLDGRRVGKTPILAEPVTPGRHILEFRWPGGRGITKHVQVAPGASVVVKGG
jgi:hypothetical protein